MIVKLTPDQIAKLWDVIRFGLLKTWPIATSNKAENVQNILRNLLSETIQCWILKENEEFLGYGLTRLNVCDITGTRNLDIMTLFGFKEFPDSIWIAACEEMKKFAKANNCSFITATSDNAKILQKARQSGFMVTQFLSMEV